MGARGSHRGILVEIGQIARVGSIHLLFFVDSHDIRSGVAAFLLHLADGFLFENLFDRLLRVHAAQLRVVRKHLSCDLGCHAVLSFLVTSFRVNGSTVPVCLFSFLLSLSHALRVALGRHARSIGLLGSLTSGVVLLLAALIFVSLVPLLSHFLLPVGFLLDLSDTILNHSQGLTNLEVLHVLLVIEFVRKFQQIVDVSFLLFLLLLRSSGPCWLRSLFLGLLGFRFSG